MCRSNIGNVRCDESAMSVKEYGRGERRRRNKAMKGKCLIQMQIEIGVEMMSE